MDSDALHPLHWSYAAAFELSQRRYWYNRAIAGECAAHAVAAEQRTTANIMLYVFARQDAHDQWENLCWVMCVRAN